MANSWLTRAIDRFRKPAPAPKPPSNEIEVVSTFVAGRPVPQEDWDPRKLVDEGYRRNVVVYCCVNEIASSAAAPRVYLRDRKSQEEVEEHPLLDLLARPAPGLSWYELVETLLIHQQTIGEGYLHKGRTGSGEIVELKPARPDRIQPVPDKQGNVLYYEYRIEGQSPQRIETEDLALFKLPDPINDFHGLSPLAVAGIYGDIDASAAIYLRDFFANGAMPMGLLKFKVPAVRREDRLRVQQEWAEQYGGGEITPQRGSRWHNVGVLGGDVEYQAIASEPAQLRLDAVWGMTESRLCATFGVPPQLVQARIGLQYSTYANMREARRSFWTETLAPIYRRLGDGMTRTIVAEVDENLELVFDLESIPELQEDLNQRAERATKLFLGGVASFNEARLLSDLEESKSDFYAFPGTVTMVPKEDVESGKYFKEAADAKAAAQAALAKGAKDADDGGEGKPPFGGKPDDDDDDQQALGEGARGLPFEVLGLGSLPPESEAEIMRAATTLETGFSAAVHDAIAGSDVEALAAAIERGDWRAAEKAIDVTTYVQRYGAALDEHLRREAANAMQLHLRHHEIVPREKHRDGWVTIKGRPVYIGDKGRGGGGGGDAPRAGGASPADLEPASGAPMELKPFSSFDPKLGGADRMAATIAFTKAVYDDPAVKIPKLAWDGVKGLQVRLEEAYKPGVTGYYQPDKERVNIIAQKKGHLSRNTPIHELGHHVHMAKLTDAAHNEWAELSNGGKACKISNYGRTNTGEHFAEAFRNYADTAEPKGKPGFLAPREWLKKQEPATYSFFERLYSDPSMWHAKGKRAPLADANKRYHGSKV